MVTSPSRRTGTGVGVTLAGLAIVGAGAGLAWSWRDELPDPIASHWGPGGGPDGFDSLGAVLALLVGIGGGLALLFGLVTWGVGQTAAMRRVGAGATIWSALFLTIVIVGSVEQQRGLGDARQAGSVDALLGVALAVSLVAAVLTGLLVPGDPRQPTTEAVAGDAPRVRLAAGERAVWIRRVVSPAAFAIAVPVAALLVGLAVWLRTWPLIGVGIVLIGVLGALGSFVVRVDGSGLLVRSVVGWPRLRVPLDEVVRADATTVSPLREFGGWGLRAARDGTLGVVMRAGPALRVARSGNRAIVVTVDDPDTAAGLLNALADRARARG